MLTVAEQAEGTDAQIEDVKNMIDKKIGNNVQTVPYTVGTGLDKKRALYNRTRNNITPFGWTVLNVYNPAESYPWLGGFWPSLRNRTV